MGENDTPSVEATIPSISIPDEEDTMELSTEILIMICIMLISIIGGNFLRKRKSKYLQEAGLTTLIGITAGSLLLAINKRNYMENLQKHFRAIFLIILLPCIILESGFNMKKTSFFKNLGTVLMFAFVGTFIAIISLGFLIKFLTLSGWIPHFSWRESFAFSSLISATDPVSVLAIFKEFNTDINLYTLVFGESIFNDVICILLYRLIHRFEYREGSNLLLQLSTPFLDFFVTLFGSFFIGAISALIIAYIIKRGKKSQTIKMDNEIAMMILCPWVSYLIAEGLKLSGIVSILINGVFVAQYVVPNLSKTPRAVMKAGFETAAWAAESIVFLFIGLGIFAVDNAFDEIGAPGIIATCILFNISRALNIFITSAICNLTRKEHKINRKYQFIMWLAGLRGAMAYALSLESIKDYSSGKVMLVITLVYSLFSVLFIGSIMGPILKYIGVEKTQEDLQTQIEIDESFYGGDRNALERVINCGERLKMFLYQFNQNYFRKIFILEDFQSDEVSEGNLSPRSQVQPKRKSESELFNVKFQNHDLNRNKLELSHKLEEEKHSDDRSA